MTRDRLILALQQEFAVRREDNLRAYDERVNDICERCQGLKPLLDARRSALMEGLRSALYPARKDTQANAGLSDTLSGYNERIAARIKACGLPQDALAPIYTCPLCKDEGYVYEPTRRMCGCFERELNQRLLTESGLQPALTFENYAETYFSDEPLVGRLSQRVLMRRNRDLCQRYADMFPETEARDLLFTGKSGLGKTFLMQSIAHRVTERGFSATYISAYKLLELMRKAYFENNSDLMEPLMLTPLLLVDDLGTEPLMENITVTQLFNLLNERQNANRHTVISTNLNVLELKTRYTERITSRLLDESRCRIVKFMGDDIRERLGKSLVAERGENA